ncbi:MAG: hypothetical protein ACYTXF_34325 [Nostoc sp.]
MNVLNFRLILPSGIARTAIAQGAVAEPIAPTQSTSRTISHPLAEASI